ncbi:uncharacterized protein [Physcomitrium patens]|uniref:Uncharacterized protein n=1 Tax=Physcomitrium patens TaxID=3218 RepID=A0A2K1IAT7_PHYPA|nr:uncharacterized protein LOC112278319 isoform X1 [Physcomitrium patens]PNR26391.1 hypothetical protein PHYPA_030966 [Physcomitrium patens]|eukprot:XP_024367371.1 uncharacterized protein LOC112278319 isoform X1 [Physcomitrella patens]
MEAIDVYRVCFGCSVVGSVRTEGLAVGRMFDTRLCNMVSVLSTCTSSPWVTPVGTVSGYSLRIESRASVSNSCFGIRFPRRSHSIWILPPPHCSKGDGDEHEESFSESSENSSSWQHSQDDLVGHGGVGSPLSNSPDEAELNRLRRENSELRGSLGELSKSLASVSAALSEVSRAVQLVTIAVGYGRPADGVDLTEAPPAVEMTEIPPEKTAEQEPQPLPTGAGIPEITDIPQIEDPVERQLMEQNVKAHKIAYKIQQVFFQARIEGLGKPFQLAAEDFVTNCMEAHTMGIGLKELQLQLILLEGSLTGAFSIRNQRYSDDPIMSEESRLRSSWVQLIYSTLAEVKARRSRLEPEASKEREEPGPSYDFVKQLVILAFEQGYDIERLKLEQNMSGPSMSGAVKTMRQCTYLVFLTLQKAINDAL